MARVVVEADFGASPDDVWKVVGDFAGVVEAMGFPVEVEGDGIGAVRTVMTTEDQLRQLMGQEPIGSTDTVTLMERLDYFDDNEKHVEYSMNSGGPIPIRDYHASVQVLAIDNGRTALTWSSTFEPVGVSDEVAEQIVRSTYEFGIAQLTVLFGS